MKEKLLLIPGPSPVHPRIIQSLSLPTVSHVGPEMVRELREALENLKRVVFCARGEPFVISGAGTLAMEMALLNTVTSGERILVLSQGYFGKRMEEICKAFRLDCDFVEKPWGAAVSADELEQRLRQQGYQVVVSTHVDTSTGACAPVKEYARVLRNRNITFILDGVCATGGIEERMDDWGIDVVLTAAQKCFGAPPGLSILVLSERAMEKRRKMASVPAYYSDLLRWLPIMKDPSKYFSTPCVNEIMAFAEGTRLVIEEGIERRFARHALFARAIRAGLAALGCSLFTQEAFLADTLSVVRYPEGIEDGRFRALLNENGVVVAGGLGETAGRVFRMGHMGNLSIAQLTFALDALERTFSSLGVRFEPGTGVAAARKVLEAS